jgi:hypothetical protein
MNKSIFPRITWMPFGDDNKSNRRYDESGTPFKISALSVPTPDVRWEISYFSGFFQCQPYDAATGAPRNDVIAGMRFYAPEDHYDPRPNTPKQLLERKTREVGHASGSRGTLYRGHAVSISSGAGVLHISWDFDEYKHPKID